MGKEIEVGSCDDVGASTANRDVDTARIRDELLDCLRDLQNVAHLQGDSLLVVGASSSEIVGQKIGTATSLEVGKVVVQTVLSFADEVGCQVAFQCCEHLNRALVVSRSLAHDKGWPEVTVVPVPGAGGSVASHAFFAMQDACVVERIEADAGIDIGDTFIGMHLKRVAVPVRGRLKEIGCAHVTMAKTRPLLYGGPRAVYDVEEARKRLTMANRD